MKTLIFAAIWFSLPLLISCARLLPTPEPLRVVENRQTDRADRLFIFLPGIGDRPEDFASKGFFAALNDYAEQSDQSIDMVAANTHVGYYAKEIVIERIHADIVEPAIEAGYKEIWLVGISLGGLGTLSYIREHGDLITGAITLAPYMGEPDLIEEIAVAGGPDNWEPGEIEAGDYGRKLWAWLKDYPDEAANRPNLWVLYGDDDHFAQANGMLAELLPSERSEVIRGGHDWETWTSLWSEFMMGDW